MSSNVLLRLGTVAARAFNLGGLKGLGGLLAGVLMAGCHGQSPTPSAALAPGGAGSALADGLAIPGGPHVVQLRVYTNAAPQATHLFNTFSLEAFGEVLLQSPARRPFGPLDPVSPWPSSLHHIVINGAGPDLTAHNSMRLVEQASGPEWRYWAWDLSAAYAGRVRELRRALVYVEPDLFVLYDRLVAPQPVSFDLLLHPPAATMVDPDWGDLRLELPKAGARIHAPAPKGFLRPWKRIESPADALLPGTITVRLGPTNLVSELDLLVVCVVYAAGGEQGFAFKFLESPTALGARIHRQGLPSLVAFRTDRAAPSASLTGFGFDGPVGVAVFKPKPRTR